MSDLTSSPESSSTPDKLKAFVDHGVNLTWDETGHAKGDCPFCSKERKLYINQETGQWDCKSCFAKGNIASFLSQMYQMMDSMPKDFSLLRRERRYMEESTLEFWGVRESLLTSEWMIPAFDVEGKITNLYRYVDLPGGKRRLYSTSKVNPGLFGVQLYDKKKPEVWIFEGPWDAMAMYEVLRTTKKTDKGLLRTGAESASLYANINILAVPGANTWLPSWAELLDGKKLVLWYDNDYPRQHKVTKQIIPSAGLEGMKRVVERLCKADYQPNEVRYLHWGTDGYDEKFPDGYDVRDFLTQGEKPEEEGKDTVRRMNLALLLRKTLPTPSDWIPGNAKGGEAGSVQLEPLPCHDWRTLVNACKKALKWNEGLDRGLSTLLSVILSTGTPGDQIWLKLIGPASSGKTTICEIVSACKRYILAKSKIKGIHSGMQIEGRKDISLISRLPGMTLIIKDADTLLAMGNLGEILSELRDAFDRVSRTDYRNGVAEDHEGKSFTVILSGTESIRRLDTSELGERFIDCNLFDFIDEEMESETALAVVERRFKNMKLKPDPKNMMLDSPEIVEAKRLAIGYIHHLRYESWKKFEELTIDEETKKKIRDLGLFAAYMRSRPNPKQKENAQRELCYRLTDTLTGMATCQAVVLNRTNIDEEVLRRVRKCALDTARGRMLDIAKIMYKLGKQGVMEMDLHLYTNQDEKEEQLNLKFLRKIGVVKSFTQKIGRAMQHVPRFRLTDNFRALYQRVFEIEPNE